MEQAAAFDAANFGIKYSDRQNLTVIGLTVNFLLCPSEDKTEKFDARYGLGNYGWNQGTWYVWGGYNGQKNNGMFGINFGRRIAEVRDGTSNTLMASESKTWGPSLRVCSGITGLNPNVTPTVQEVLQIVANNYGSCSRTKDPWGTRWANGALYYSGITAALPPNAKSSAGPDRSVYFNLITTDENEGAPTYGAVAARSYHPGGVNTLFADGSVRFIKDTVDANAWRGIFTPKGGEVVSADQL
jgi:prepilin-type processing-associated H-X9-DG protein